MAKRSYRFIRFLDELGMEDVPAVGGKTTLAILETERELGRRRQPRSTERVSTPVGRAEPLSLEEARHVARPRAGARGS